MARHAAPRRHNRMRIVAAGLVLTAGSVATAKGLAGAAPVVRPSAVSGDVISGYKDQYHLVTGANQQALVGSLNLPAGGFAIFAKAYTTVPLPDGAARTIRCYLRAGQDFDQQIVDHDAVVAGATIALQVNHVFSSPGQVSLTCGYLYQSGQTYLGFVKLTAVAAGHVSIAPMA
jgi:hypothetical protein